MSNEHKPLTAADDGVDDDVKVINEFLDLCSHRLDPWNMARVADAVAWLGEDKNKIVEWVHGYWGGEDVERKMMDLEKENAALRARVEKLGEALAEIGESEDRICNYCEGEGIRYADGKPHYYHEHAPTIPCPECGGWGRIRDMSSEDMANIALAALAECAEPDTGGQR